MNTRFDITPGASHPPVPAAAWAALLVDEIECGLVVCSAEGRIGFANQAAQRELAAGRLLLQDAGLLRRAAGASGGLDAAIALAIQRGRRQLVTLQAGDDRLLVSVLPLSLQGEPHALVMMGRRTPCSELGLEMLAASHGLTLAERRVLGGLVRRHAPREIAERHGVRLSTVRTQVAAIRAKFGARNIDELLLRTAEMPPVAGALRLSQAITAPMFAQAA